MHWRECARASDRLSEPRPLHRVITPSKNKRPHHANQELSPRHHLDCNAEPRSARKRRTAGDPTSAGTWPTTTQARTNPRAEANRSEARARCAKADRSSAGTSSCTRHRAKARAKARTKDRARCAKANRASAGTSSCTRHRAKARAKARTKDRARCAKADRSSTGTCSGARHRAKARAKASTKDRLSQPQTLDPVQIRRRMSPLMRRCAFCTRVATRQ